MAKTFEEMDIWQDAKYLTIAIYSIMKDNRDFGFKDQIQRASVSIMNNIAEGFEAGSDNLFTRYLHIAKGSCGEVRSMLILSKDLKYLTTEQADRLIEKCISISKRMSSLIQYLTKNK